MLLPFVTLALLSGCQNDPYAGTAALEEQPLPFDMPILEDADRSVYLSSDSAIVRTYEFIWVFEFDDAPNNAKSLIKENITNSGLVIDEVMTRKDGFYIHCKDSEGEVWGLVCVNSKAVSLKDGGGFSIIMSNLTNTKRFKDAEITKEEWMDKEAQSQKKER